LRVGGCRRGGYFQERSDDELRGGDMRTIDTWLQRYAAGHRHPVNKRIHRVAVPIIVLDLLGFASLLTPAAAWLIVGAALVFYARLSRPLAAGMAALGLAALALVGAAAGVTGEAFPAWLVAVFVVTWVAQFIGHHLEGVKPAFFEDLQFLLIGPLWLLADAYDRAGIGWRTAAATPPPSARAEART
jgi:uncharacterized membrane protein YGL010W